MWCYNIVTYVVLFVTLACAISPSRTQPEGCGYQTKNLIMTQPLSGGLRSIDLIWSGTLQSAIFRHPKGRPTSRLEFPDEIGGRPSLSGGVQ